MLVLRDKDHTLVVQTPQAYPFLGYVYLTAFLRQRLCLFSISKGYSYCKVSDKTGGLVVTV